MSGTDAGPSLAERLVAAHFPASDDELVVGALPARELAARHGTPLYVFDAAVLRARLADVQKALGDRVEVLFALKANPNAAVARVLREGGAGAEVASAGEILVARRAGFAGRSMQFAGPGKHGDDLRLALADGVTLNVESAAELDAVARAAAEAGVVCPVALRVNPPAATAGSRMRMGGGSAKFGIDVDALVEVARQAEAAASIELRGLHTYAGTQTFDHEGWLAHARFLLDSARAVEGAIGRELPTLNFGGGFGVPVFESDGDFDLGAAGGGLQALVADDARPDRRYFVELGRYLVAPAGVFLARVIYLKESAGKTHAILDGGMHHHAAAAGLGTVIRRPFPMVKATALRAAAGEGCQLGGPLCTPADAFPTGASLPPLEPGDLVAFLSSGAYGLTFSNVLFLSHAAPAEVLVDGREAHVVRAAGRPDDALRGQRLPGEA
ncbi:MAG: alanine racemase [Sandaracinaceae bacterium]